MEAWLFATAFCALLATFVLSQPATLSRLEKAFAGLGAKLAALREAAAARALERSAAADLFRFWALCLDTAYHSHDDPRGAAARNGEPGPAWADTRVAELFPVVRDVVNPYDGARYAARPSHQRWLDESATAAEARRSVYDAR